MVADDQLDALLARLRALAQSHIEAANDDLRRPAAEQNPGIRHANVAVSCAYGHAALLVENVIAGEPLPELDAQLRI